MKSPLLTVLSCCACLLLSGCGDTVAEQSGAHSDNSAAIRILPLGDSITQADQRHMSYRFWLWQSLSTAGLAVDFVGTNASNHEGNPAFPDDFDRNHQGHWGWRTDQVLAQLPEWLQHYQADYVLLHLGTNDCLQGQPVQETVSELKAIVRTLQRHNPSMSIVLFPLGPSSWQGSACLDSLNQRVQESVNAWRTETSVVRIASAPKQFDVEKHTYDGLHPNEAGEKLLAQAWQAAIQGLLQSQ